MRGSFAVMAAERFDHRMLVLLTEADEIEMRTPRGDGSMSSRPIWVVVVDHVPYVRSYAGERGRWYRRAKADGRAELGVEGEALAVRAVPDGGAELDEKISAAYHVKYGRHAPGPTEAMVTPPVVATTMRLEPADG
ncbi:MAG: DUF2255 family protein [Actinobacteria bacterium]|nr:MAG: DUF2255 family protein [Actinomycetota bacterium]